MDIGHLRVVNCYLPPTNSCWANSAPISPEEKLAQMAACCALSAAYVILAGDFNACTNSYQSEHSSLKRKSSDMAPISGHGCVLLQLAADSELHILNGLTWQTKSSQDRFTSFQPNGCAVVDYFLVSTALLYQWLSQNISAHGPTMHCFT